MTESFLDQILNFIIPIAVFGFIFWILYRIPIFKEMVDWIIEKIKGVKSNQESQVNKMQNITYE